MTEPKPASRYERIIAQIFQAHFVPGTTEFEFDRRGAHYVLPVQAKGGPDRLSIVQIEQDFRLCAAKFPRLICRPIAAQFMASQVIALFSFEMQGIDVAIASEAHYRLVSPAELSGPELNAYRARS